MTGRASDPSKSQEQKPTEQDDIDALLDECVDLVMSTNVTGEHEALTQADVDKLMAARQ